MNEPLSVTPSGCAAFVDAFKVTNSGDGVETADVVNRGMLDFYLTFNENGDVVVVPDFTNYDRKAETRADAPDGESTKDGAA